MAMKFCRSHGSDCGGSVSHENSVMSGTVRRYHRLCLCVGRECEFREEKGEVFQPGELGVPGQGVLRRGEDLAPIVFHTRTIMTFEFKHTADAAEARRIIDAEIAVHEAAIRRLGHCRNTYSSISRLPSEIVATIFLLVKSELGQGAVGHISGVCRQWREILLASPRIWSSINVSRVESVLELLKRSKSVPLKIKCEEYSCTEPHRRAAEAVMAEVGRIQDLNLSLPPKDLVDFLRLNGDASASMIEHLQLRAVYPPESFSLPRDIMRREMPSLRLLDLTNMVISSQLPMLPHLTCLRISCHRIHGSLLLSSLQCTPKLKELRVEGGLVMDGPMGPLTGPVQLPNLTYITIISVDLESAAVFANIEYPPRANVFFRHDRQHRGEPDLSALVAMSRRFQIAPLPIDTALLGCSSSGQLRIFIESTHHSGSWQLSLLLNVESRYSSATCITLCSALSLGDVTILRLSAFIDMNPTELTSFYRLFPRVQALHWNNTPAWYFRTLMKSPSIELPLPGLERLYLSKCDFMVMDAQLFEGLKGFLKERKDLGTPVVRAKIRMSSITEEAVEDLEEFTEVDWDGEESVFGSDEECLSYGTSYGSS
ncbi:hypothetical protein BDN71DRAFT_1032273 [Pleurotus eryngii]|uniref:F-box domain-containing protein n=1 Tax=Pleurotus eryngii TaxID=5323 RepID=A0A9P6DKF2_PLEER|nr:hypothetical protein BDN71DRAFT_1032273 [Pleurotus eryngii]